MKWNISAQFICLFDLLYICIIAILQKVLNQKHHNNKEKVGIRNVSLSVDADE